MAKKKRSKASRAAAASKAKTESNNNSTDHSGIKVEVFQALWDDFANKTTDNANNNKLVGAIDQGTSSTRFLVFTSTGKIAASAQMEHEQILFPEHAAAGYHEHDPVVLWHNTCACMTAVCKNMHDACETPVSLAAIGITNQRETTIAWNRDTGQPYYNAIVWDDTRTADIANAIISDNKEKITATTGLPLSSYFAGTKVKWLLDNVEALRRDVETVPEKVCFGTVDSWLLYNLTGNYCEQPKSKFNTGGVFKTDVTNASRWLFMDLQTCQWDTEMMNIVCAPHTLPVQCLPEICPSSGLFGKINCAANNNNNLLPASLQGVPLTAVLGDQQAALFGQAAFEAGMAKNTFGTGLFLMMNTGSRIVPSTHGLLTTVAYQIGTNDADICYALEGSVSHSGSTIQWLRDQLKIIRSAAESETLANTVGSNDDLYFVPAFAGLFAPHWRSDARGCIVGLTASHHAGHICRAALEAAAYQTNEVFEAIVKDSHDVALKSLNVDGGGTNNKLLMQFQADIINVPVVKPVVMETTALGAAFAAGLAVGVWKDLDEIKSLWAVAETFEPKMSDEERAKNIAGWNKAVSKSLGWVGSSGHDHHDEGHETNGNKQELSNGKVPLPVTATNVTPESVDEPTVITDEQQQKQQQQPTEESESVAHVGDVDEVHAEVHRSREISPVENNDNETKDGFSAVTLALTAGAALGIGLLLGSARNKRS